MSRQPAGRTTLQWIPGGRPHGHRPRPDFSGVRSWFLTVRLRASKIKIW